MNVNTAHELLTDQARVRVFNVQGDVVFCEGVVIAYHDGPMLCVKDDDGNHHWHPMTLPMERATWVAA